ncbi:histidine kinase [Kribbella sp. NPDC051770]|uniref:sensor histidine kinase n=1 Tax=Kribbella sp. NPDC051770 TaxID=3155413 RepID=UPI00343466E1
MTRKQPLLGWTGILARLLITAVVAGVLVTADPAESWAWPVLVVSLLSFLAGTFLMHRHELWSLGLLSYAALSAAVVVGMPGSNALILVLVPVTDVAVMTFTRTPELRRNQPIIAVGIGCLVAYAVSAALFDRTSSWFLSQLLWTAVLILFGLNRRHDELRNQQTSALLDQTRLAQREHARAAALDERTRIARELHDVLAHSLGALSVQLELAEALLSEKHDSEAALDRIRHSRRLAVQGLTEARNAVATLRQDQVPALVDALSTLTTHHTEDHTAPAHFTTTGAARPLAPGVVVALLGAARESLTNAARHAPGQPVEAHLTYHPTGVRLEIRNPLTQPRLSSAGMRPDRPHGLRPLRPEGRRSGPEGGEAASGPDGDGAGGGSVHSAAVGYGLAGMRERVALVGGTLSAGIVDGEWVVVAEVADE